MTRDTLPFESRKPYSKLQFRVFPTIRRDDTHGDVGDINEITHGPDGNREALGMAEVIAKETICLTDDRFTDNFFKFDTEAESWDHAYESLCGFYDTAIEPSEELTLYWNLWVDRYE